MLILRISCLEILSAWASLTSRSCIKNGLVSYLCLKLPSMANGPTFFSHWICVPAIIIFKFSIIYHVYMKQKTVTVDEIYEDLRKHGVNIEQVKVTKPNVEQLDSFKNGLLQLIEGKSIIGTCTDYNQKIVMTPAHDGFGL